MDRHLVILTAASAPVLTTAQAVMAEMGITDPGVAAGMTTLISQASAVIMSAIGRTIIKEAVKEEIWPDQFCRSIRLSRTPIITITSIVEDGVVLGDDDFRAEKSSGILHRLAPAGHTVPWCATKLEITYEGGLDPALIPADLQRACTSLTKLAYSASTRDPFLKSQEVPGVLTETYWVGSIGSGGIPDDIMAMIKPYRRGLRVGP
jgi:hypothetical protein